MKRKDFIGKALNFFNYVTGLADASWPSRCGTDDGYAEIVTTENIIGIPVSALAGGEIDSDGKGGTGYTDSEDTFHRH